MARLTSRCVRSLALSGLWLTALAGVQAVADTQAQIVSTDLRSTLASNEAFNVRVKFNTSERVALWVQPYFRGKPVKKAMLAASSQYVGKGEMVSWFTLTEPGKVDEVRVMAGGGNPWRRWDVTQQSLELQWTSEVATAEIAAPGTDDRVSSDAEGEEAQEDISSAERVVHASEP